MMEENSNIFPAGGDALVYLSGPMHKKYSTTIVWGHPFSTYVRVFTSIHREGFICLDQVGYQGTDQRCYVEDVNFLCQIPSSLLQNAATNLSNQSILFANQKPAKPRVNQCTSRSQNMGPSFTIQQESSSVRTTSQADLTLTRGVAI